MKKNNQAKFTAYLSGPLSIALGFSLAILFFSFVLKDTSPVPFFLIFACLEIGGMIMYAVLPKKFKNIARMTAMFLFTAFLFLLAGVLGRNNFQLEGFWMYLFSGTIGGATVHYVMAKIVGPIFFARNWCSWGCWTSVIFDLLPFKKNISWKSSNSGKFRTVHFLCSFGLVAILFYVFKFSFLQTDPQALQAGMGTQAELAWFLIGNAFYYLSGIILAFIYKDNRAFCKYLCPVTVFLKFTSKFTLLRIKGDAKKCNNCQTCVQNCPMAINIPKYIKEGSRIKSTECIMCLKCIAECPQAALQNSIGLDFANKEYLK